MVFVLIYIILNMEKFSFNFKDSLVCYFYLYFLRLSILKFFVIIRDFFLMVNPRKRHGVTHNQWVFWAVVGSGDFPNMFFFWQVNLPS